MKKLLLVSLIMFGLVHNCRALSIKERAIKFWNCAMNPKKSKCSSEQQGFAITALVLAAGAVAGGVAIATSAAHDQMVQYELEKTIKENPDSVSAILAQAKLRERALSYELRGMPLSAAGYNEKNAELQQLQHQIQTIESNLKKSQ